MTDETSMTAAEARELLGLSLTSRYFDACEASLRVSYEAMTRGDKAASERARRALEVLRTEGGLPRSIREQPEGTAGAAITSLRAVLAQGSEARAEAVTRGRAALRRNLCRDAAGSNLRRVLNASESED